MQTDTLFAAELGKPPEPYERSLFTREDAVEETWRVLQPLVDHPPASHPTGVGSRGPPGADDLLGNHPPWQPPWLPAQGGIAIGHELG